MSHFFKIDISENILRNRGHILDILLTDYTRTTKRKKHNIIWATDSYEKKNHDKSYGPKMQIKREQITGLNGTVIQPRASKSKEEQIARTKDKAEVFTPLKIVKQMNMAIDWASKNYPATEDSWVEYIKELRLEITCGEAPFIAGRYNPTANTGIVITPRNRVGFLDSKLQIVGEFTNSKKDWLKYAEIALKATYGYEWQGDNMLIARENVLLTLEDFYKDFCANKLNLKTKQCLTDEQLEYFAEIISWNIFQMDGLKYVVPMSCKPKKDKPKQQVLFEDTTIIVEDLQCEGCKYNQPTKHNGIYVNIMDWTEDKTIRFIDLTNQQERLAEKYL